MKHLLITGFDPFGGESVNPSWEAVSRLPEHIMDTPVHKLRLPVVFGEAADLLRRSKVPMRKVYVQNTDGQLEEMRL